MELESISLPNGLCRISLFEVLCQWRIEKAGGRRVRLLILLVARSLFRSSSLTESLDQANITCKRRDKGQLEKSRISCSCLDKETADRQKLFIIVLKVVLLSWIKPFFPSKGALRSSAHRERKIWNLAIGFFSRACYVALFYVQLSVHPFQAHGHTLTLLCQGAFPVPGLACAYHNEWVAQ